MSESVIFICGPEEAWRRVPGFPNYEVSNCGRYRSKRHMTVAGMRGGKILKLRADPAGYLYAGLWIDGVCTNHRVHRMAAAAFLGPRPEGLQVCHASGDNQDNHLVNLRYGTRKENADDLVRIGGQSRGELRPFAKLTEVTVLEIRQRYADSQISQGALAEEYGVCRGTIAKAVTGQTWKHVA
jgi:HNH endonuclease/NUMOD4 motif